jgi:hypothetical protein
MRPRLPRWLLSLLVACLFLALVAGQSWATHRFFTSGFPGGNDFYSRWANGCALIWTGENPYSDEVTLRTQIGMFGRPARVARWRPPAWLWGTMLVWAVLNYPHARALILGGRWRPWSSWRWRRPCGRWGGSGTSWREHCWRSPPSSHR